VFFSLKANKAPVFVGDFVLRAVKSFFFFFFFSSRLLKEVNYEVSGQSYTTPFFFLYFFVRCLH
jgi:hypothetical protein